MAEKTLLCLFLTFCLSLANPTSNCTSNLLAPCRGLGYNYTVYPNGFGQNQSEAEQELSLLVPLMKIQCSTYIQEFLCSLYAPVCTILERPIPPCREICDAARSGCESIINQYGMNWPEKFDCERFPTKNGDEMCISQASSESTTQSPISILTSTATEKEAPIDRSPPPCQELEESLKAFIDTKFRVLESKIDRLTAKLHAESSEEDSSEEDDE